MQLIKYVFIVIVAFFIVSPAHAACRSIMMYGAGNTAQWESELGLKNVRAACGGIPAECLQTRLDPNTGTLRYYEKLFLGMPITNDAATAAEYALQYSTLSKTYTKLYEVSFDDFYTFWKEKLQFNNTKLKLIIDNTKKINKNLKFGITLYEDQLPLLSTITSANRGKINYVHLYLHHRNTNIEADVQTVRNLFPNAKIIAGSYAFDFKSPCSISSTGACDGTTELRYYKDSLKRQKALMDRCVIEAIEFWPAYFGNEERISFDACLAKGKTQAQCVSETKEMRNAALVILNGAPTSTSSKTPTPTRMPTITPTRRPTATSTRKPTITPTRRPTATPTNIHMNTPTSANIYTDTPTPTKAASSLTSQMKQNLDVSVKRVVSAVGETMLSFTPVSSKPSYTPTITPKITPEPKKNMNVDNPLLSLASSISATVDEGIQTVQPLEAAKTYFIVFMNFFIDTMNSFKTAVFKR